MPAPFKFFGGLSRVGDLKLSHLGQLVQLNPEVGLDAAKGGVSLLPADTYDSIGFTPQEEKDYPDPASSVKAPIEFLRKREKAAELRLLFIAGQLHEVKPEATEPDGEL